MDDNQDGESIKMENLAPDHNFEKATRFFSNRKGR